MREFCFNPLTRGLIVFVGGVVGRGGGRASFVRENSLEEKREKKRNRDGDEKRSFVLPRTSK